MLRKANYRAGREIRRGRAGCWRRPLFLSRVSSRFQQRSPRTPTIGEHESERYRPLDTAIRERTKMSPVPQMLPPQQCPPIKPSTVLPGEIVGSKFVFAKCSSGKVCTGVRAKDHQEKRTPTDASKDSVNSQTRHASPPENRRETRRKTPQESSRRCRSASWKNLFESEMSACKQQNAITSNASVAISRSGAFAGASKTNPTNNAAAPR